MGKYTTIIGVIVKMIIVLPIINVILLAIVVYVLLAHLSKCIYVF
jgi:hypothetical protein